MLFHTFQWNHLRSTSGDYLRFGIICGPIWESFTVWGSFAVGDHLRGRAERLKLDKTRNSSHDQRLTYNVLHSTRGHVLLGNRSVPGVFELCRAYPVFNRFFLVLSLIKIQSKHNPKHNSNFNSLTSPNPNTDSRWKCLVHCTSTP